MKLSLAEFAGDRIVNFKYVGGKQILAGSYEHFTRAEQDRVMEPSAQRHAAGWRRSICRNVINFRACEVRGNNRIEASCDEQLAVTEERRGMSKPGSGQICG